MWRRFSRLFIFIGFIQCCFSCDHHSMWHAHLTDRSVLKEIPSASGLERWNDRYFIIGDNTPWLFETDTLGNTLVKHRIGSGEELDVIPKSQKHDYEAMCTLDWNGEQVLFLFGSGSKWPHRNNGIAFSITRQKLIETFDLTTLYEALSENANIKQDEFNLEAATSLNGKLYLFNRGENKVIILREKDFVDFIIQNEGLPKMKVFSLELPEVEGVVSGFSGATTDEKNGMILFTASLENTSDWVQDGEVLGSFVGIFDPKKLHQHYVPHTALIEDKDGALRLKVESISLDDMTENDYHCSLVTDSDGGASELLKIRFGKTK
jgi:hypothetical protein